LEDFKGRFVFKIRNYKPRPFQLLHNVARVVGDSLIPLRKREKGGGARVLVGGGVQCTLPCGIGVLERN